MEPNAEYINKDLKRGVDYIGVTVVFYCHDGQGNILLQKRSMNCRDEQGRWDGGSGCMEFGEPTFEDAVRREVMEELGIEPISVTYVVTTNVLRDNNGTPTHWNAHVHTVVIPREGLRIGEPDKIDEIRWFPANALPENLHSCWDRHFALAKDKIIR